MYGGKGSRRLSKQQLCGNKVCRACGAAWEKVWEAGGKVGLKVKDTPSVGGSKNNDIDVVGETIEVSV